MIIFIKLNFSSIINFMYRAQILDLIFNWALMYSWNIFVYIHGDVFYWPYNEFQNLIKMLIYWCT